jgi:hypothetical protein
MEKSIVKKTTNAELHSAKSRRVNKIITEEDIRRRAFELYQENGAANHNELEDWFRAERELKNKNR